ncbi:hypothetical protein acdb102_08270 [Acidothermaceae bacterium B102]|nr:hypothetical protein acdb102_08270 [Acidothermaceae bacterium B102]
MYAISPDVPGIVFVGAFALLAWVVGSGIWRSSVARRIAERNGLDPRDASAVALLNDNGLAAAYVRSGMSGARPPAAPARTPAQRLADLDALHAAGTVTDEEYAAARQRIIDSI